MKIISILFFFSIILFGCSNPSEESNAELTSESSAPLKDHFAISGSLTNGNNKMIYLYHFNGQRTDVLDSATVDENGEFNLTGINNNFQFYAVGSEPRNIKLMLLGNNERVSLNGDYNSMQYATPSGSEHTEILDQYGKKQGEFYSNMQSLQSQLNGKNQVESANLMQQSEQLTKEFSSYVSQFIDMHAHSPAIYVAANDLFDASNRLTYLKKIENTLSKTMNSSPFHLSLRANIAKIEQQNNQPTQNSFITVGSDAPELNYSSPTNQHISLSSLRGKVVLIDFWASWCKPCRMENPNVVKLYNQYKNKGFTIYSVSLDKDQSRWVSAIQQDGLSWPNHVSDLKGWQSAAAAQYGVQSIPFTVLIDQNGKVIATNLRGYQLELKLKEILG